LLCGTLRTPLVGIIRKPDTTTKCAAFHQFIRNDSAWVLVAAVVLLFCLHVFFCECIPRVLCEIEDEEMAGFPHVSSAHRMIPMTAAGAFNEADRSPRAAQTGLLGLNPPALVLP
jgi:hypothetical protein